MTDASVIIDLCCNLGGQEDIKPLTITEWSKVAEILWRNKLQPKDLAAMKFDACEDLLGSSVAGNDRIQRLLDRSGALAFEISKYEKYGIRIVTRADATYPQKLKDHLGKYCPPLFFYVGSLNLLNESCCGFVGSRSIAVEDEIMTRKFVCRIVDNGYTTVSGGAKGIDSLASVTALERGGGVVEFLADSMLKRLRSDLFCKGIEEERMLIMSYVYPQAPFNVGNAMGRNKFIYAQSEGTVVIRSDLGKGGTWSGAMESIRHKWGQVLCWNNKEYDGNQALIKHGAESISDQWSGKFGQSLSVGMVCDEPQYEQLALNFA